MERPHQGIENRIIEPEARTYRNTGEYGACEDEHRQKPVRVKPRDAAGASQIVKSARLGGLLKYYYRADDPRVGDGTDRREEKAAA